MITCLRSRLLQSLHRVLQGDNNCVIALEEWGQVFTLAGHLEIHYLTTGRLLNMK
jgi:hypothetical protein